MHGDSLCHPFGVPFCAVICYTGVYTPACRISPRWGFVLHRSSERGRVIGSQMLGRVLLRPSDSFAPSALNF